MQNAGLTGNETENKQITNNKMQSQILQFPALWLPAERYGQLNL